MSPSDKLKSLYGEKHQGSYLLEAKERNSDTKKRISSKTPDRLANSRPKPYRGYTQQYS